jgi:isoleucyl-tRNA synthetase
MFEAVSPKTSVVELETAQLTFWRERDIFRRSMEERKGGPLFVFYEGPPTANGVPGIHHVLARAFKDMFPRYRTMRGYYVLRKGGWDTHGLPVEIEVEKKLGLTSKRQIEEYGIAAFNEKCRASVFEYVQEWEELTERIAFWVSLEDAYITYKNEYIQSVWWILRQFWNKGLLFQGYKSVPYCARCGTALSSHELNMGYKDDTVDPSITVRFTLRDQPDTHILAWTTTPWTLPGNTALAVGEDIDYVKVRGKNSSGKEEYLILAEARREAVLGDANYEVVEQMKGRALVGLRYQPLYTFLPTDKDYAYVLGGDFVSTEDGTGIVHIAPAFGADDLEVGLAHGLPVLQTVEPDGSFRKEVTPWAGMWVKDADPLIIEELVSRGLMFHVGTYMHTYPFCWRCDTPLLYYARPTWYVRTTDYRDKLVALNQTINWVPEHIRDGRFGKWLEGNVDWALGRERYWGTPLPVWVCDSCGHQHCVGGIDELSELTGEDQSGLDLHRPFVDEITWGCTECNSGTMHRVPEVIDCWFDSGSMPVAQWGYPYHNKELFEEQFPADYICEAVDQTRGWFYSLHAISTLLFEEVCFRNCLCLGHVVDPDGKKMSKSLGNAPDPWEVINAYGADALRWYMYTAGPPGETRRFSPDYVNQIVRAFWLTLWNVYSFFVTYANIDGFDPSQAPNIPVAGRDSLDRWILAELHALIRDVTEAYETYDVAGTTRPIEVFVDRLSNWYVRRSRRRFWKSGDDADKAAAYLTLYECLVTLGKLLAPTMPFLSEALYRNLVGSVEKDAPESVHLAAWPAFDEALIDEGLLEEMRLVMRLVSLGHSARNSAQVKVRQPLAEVEFVLTSARERETAQAYADLIADELNVKQVSVLAEAGEMIGYHLNPLPAALGPRLGADFPKLQSMLRAADVSAFAQTLLSGEPISVSIDGKEMMLTPEEVEVQMEAAEGFALAHESRLVALLDTRLTEELALEGLAREFIRRVQTLRRDADFEIDARIVTAYQASERLAQAVSRFDELIRAETLSVTLDNTATPDGVVTGDYTFEGESLKLGLQVVAP